MLNDHGVGAHFDHKTAGILEARRRHEEFVTAMKQDDQILERTAVAVDIAHEIDDIERVCSSGIPGRNRELVLSNGENADSDSIYLLYQDFASGRDVCSGTDRRKPSFGANLESVGKARKPVIEDMIVR